jgi:23S rRNA (cytosine1962-C5)-methyltransferase
MIISNDWKDYEILDTSDGEKLERWGKVILRRPDPQIIWNTEKSKEWNKVSGWYHRSESGGGNWEFFESLPEKWQISYKDLKFYVKPMNFKHTGLFPEQAVNWDWMIQKIKNAGRDINVLNLFAYTGGASIACAYAGASVCHVDAAKGSSPGAEVMSKKTDPEPRVPSAFTG